jgi:DNA-binding transcriptional ArsR family regulator
MAKAKGSNWCFFSSHGLVLICVSRDPYLRLAEIADRVGLTPRAVQTVLRDLEGHGVIERLKEGRRNRYIVNLEAGFRHPLTYGLSLSEGLADIIGSDPEPALAGVGAGRDG